MAAWWSYFSTVSHSNSKHFQSFSTFIYLHLLCFSSSSSNTCPILPTESCLLVWKYVLLHSSVKQPTCISPSDQALIAFPNLIIKSLLFLFFLFVSLAFIYTHLLSVMLLREYVTWTSFCLLSYSDTYIFSGAGNSCGTNWTAVGWTPSLHSRLGGLIKVCSKYNTVYGSVLHGYRGSLHDTANIFWQDCLHCGSTAICTFTWVRVFSNLPFRSQYCNRRRDKGIEFESTLGY